MSRRWESPTAIAGLARGLAAVADAAHQQSELDVLARAEERHEAALLRDDADVHAAQPRQLAAIEARELLPEQADLAEIRPIEAREQAQERRLARA